MSEDTPAEQPTEQPTESKGVSMAHQWTDEQRAKFRETMQRINSKKLADKVEKAHKKALAAQRKARYKQKLRYKGNGLEQRKTDVSPADLPVIELSDGNLKDIQEFAAFMAAAWRVYKGL